MKQIITYQIRHAEVSEADQLTALAIRSQGSWGYPQAWMDLWRERLTITPEIIKNSISLVAEYEGVIRGFWCRSFENNAEKPTRGFLFVEPDFIRKGCGKQLFQAMKEELVKRNITSFNIIAEPNALSFYLRMGGEKILEIESPTPIRMLPVIRFDLAKNKK